MEIEAKTLTSSLTTDGEETDVKWFKEMKSPVADWLKLPSINIEGFFKNLQEAISSLKNVGEALKDLGKKLGNWNSIFKGASKKIEEYKGAIISFAKKPGGWVAGALAAVTAVGAAIGLNAIGANPVNVVQAGLNFGEALWNFNFQYTDKQIMDQIKSLIDGMYSSAGDFAGKSLAQLIVGGTLTPPKVQINVRGLALNWLINPEIREEMLQNVSSFAYQGITVAKQIMVRFALLKGRHALKEYWKVAPGWAKKAVSSVWKDADKVITNWGNEGNKPWSIATHVEEKVEKIEDQKLQDFTENFLESFWEGFRESVEYVYN